MTRKPAVAGGEHQVPVGADSGAAVEQQERLAVAPLLEIHLETVDVDDHRGVGDGRRVHAARLCVNARPGS
jgi:hypothetical protein